MGKSLNQTVRDYPEQLAGQNNWPPSQRPSKSRRWPAQGALNGWRFNRDEANERGSRYA